MLLAISVFVALIFFALFIYSVKKGQYDDTYTPSVRMLFEDELVAYYEAIHMTATLQKDGVLRNTGLGDGSRGDSRYEV